MNIQEIFGQAVQLYKTGKRDEAEQYCKQLVQLQPAFADAYNLSGLIAKDKQDYTGAIKLYRKALQISSNNLVYYNNLGQALWLSDKGDEALKTFHKVLGINPDYIPTLIQLGKNYRSMLQYDKAIECFEKVLKQKPDHISALNNLANVYQMQHKMNKAMEVYLQALQLNSNVPELHFNLANVYMHTGQDQEAERRFLEALKINPAFVKSHVALAQLYAQRSEQKLSKLHLKQALQLDPKNSEALFVLGNYYRSVGELEKAIACFKQCIAANSKHVMAYSNMGMTYFSIGMTLESEQAFTNALQLNPSLPESLFGMAKLKENEKKYAESVSWFERALAVPSSFETQLHFDFFLLKLRIASWDTYDEDVQRLKERLSVYLADPQLSYQISPLTLNYFPIEQELHLKTAQFYAKRMEAQAEAAKEVLKFTYPEYTEGEKLRIGYISPDFRFHAVGMLLNQLFQYHDKSNVEVYAYSIINNNDEYHRLFQAGADVFRDITRLSHEEAARLINKDQVHVLIDLAGYTTYTRTPILALKPAKIQMQFMGYPDTTGSSFMDYILADEYLIPEQDQKYYSEKVAYLPHAFFSSPFKTSTKAISKKELGLPEDAFVYCCFNSYHKLAPEIFDVWTEILKRTENSVLWLTKESEEGAENIRKEVRRRGLNEERIVFAQRLPLDEYLASYRCADLFLDTFNYSAGSTAICALWGEVPILTYAGVNNASRMGASITHAAGLDAFICKSKKEYLDKAVAYYHNPEQLRKDAGELKVNKQSLPVFDLGQAAKSIEHAAYKAVMALYAEPKH